MFSLADDCERWFIRFDPVTRPALTPRMLPAPQVVRFSNNQLRALHEPAGLRVADPRSALQQGAGFIPQEPELFRYTLAQFQSPFGGQQPCGINSALRASMRRSRSWSQCKRGGERRLSMARSPPEDGT